MQVLAIARPAVGLPVMYTTPAVTARLNLLHLNLLQAVRSRAYRVLPELALLPGLGPPVWPLTVHRPLFFCFLVQCCLSRHSSAPAALLVMDKTPAVMTWSEFLQSCVQGLWCTLHEQAHYCTSTALVQACLSGGCSKRALTGAGHQE